LCYLSLFIITPLYLLCTHNLKPLFLYCAVLPSLLPNPIVCNRQYCLNLEVAILLGCGILSLGDWCLTFETAWWIQGLKCPLNRLCLLVLWWNLLPPSSRWLLIICLDSAGIRFFWSASTFLPTFISLHPNQQYIKEVLLICVLRYIISYHFS